MLLMGSRCPGRDKPEEDNLEDFIEAEKLHVRGTGASALVEIHDTV